MLVKSTYLRYSLAVLLSNEKKNFESIGRSILRTGRSVARMMQSYKRTRAILKELCQLIFGGKKMLYLILDETLIKKIYADVARGSGVFYDPGTGREVNGYRIVTALLSDGTIHIPLDADYIFPAYITERCTTKPLSKTELAKKFYLYAKKLFSETEIVLIADGHYSTYELLQWCTVNKIKVEMRIHKNRKVLYNRCYISITDLLKLPKMRPSQRRPTRTIRIKWKELVLWVTIVRRENKHGEESFVFQVATYKADPRVHRANYKRRWKIEKKYRTTKQSLGLGDCQSKNFLKQRAHMMSVLLAYAIAQLIKKKYRLKNSEEAIRWIRGKCVGLMFSESVDLVGSLMLSKT